VWFPGADTLSAGISRVSNVVSWITCRSDYIGMTAGGPGPPGGRIEPAKFFRMTMTSVSPDAMFVSCSPYEPAKVVPDGLVRLPVGNVVVVVVAVVVVVR
jgi:hypothetical protein